MALYLKDHEVDALAREVAALQGTSITEAVKRALKEKQAQLLADRERRDREIRDLLAEIDRFPVLDARHPDEILYDEDGCPK